MKPLSLPVPGTRAMRLMVLGAHADDIEIGCGGTLLRFLEEGRRLEVTWVVFSATPEREVEARASASSFLAGVARGDVIVKHFRDGFLPWDGEALKEQFEALKRDFDPDLILTHYRDDRHQDHRIVSDLTWNTWRNHLILEYEIPKWDGDLGSPQLFAPLPEAVVDRKVALVLEHFRSQAKKPWFTADLLKALPRIRGMECNAPERLAEAFYCRKAVF